MKSLAENQLKVQVARWRKKPGRVLKVYIYKDMVKVLLNLLQVRKIETQKTKTTLTIKQICYKEEKKRLLVDV